MYFPSCFEWGRKILKKSSRVGYSPGGTAIVYLKRDEVLCAVLLHPADLHCATKALVNISRCFSSEVFCDSGSCYFSCWLAMAWVNTTAYRCHFRCLVSTSARRYHRHNIAVLF